MDGSIDMRRFQIQIVHLTFPNSFVYSFLLILVFTIRFSFLLKLKFCLVEDKNKDKWRKEEKEIVREGSG